MKNIESATRRITDAHVYTDGSGEQRVAVRYDDEQELDIPLIRMVEGYEQAVRTPSQSAPMNDTALEILRELHRLMNFEEEVASDSDCVSDPSAINAVFKKAYALVGGATLKSASLSELEAANTVSSIPRSETGFILALREQAAKTSGEVSLLLDEAASRLARSAIEPMNTALADVAAERQRQVEKEGWSTKHDDEHGPGVLAVAGACYALSAAKQVTTEHATWAETYDHCAADLWPWDREWWKPKLPRRDLVRAAALLLAEIERMDRADSGVKP